MDFGKREHPFRKLEVGHCPCRADHPPSRIEHLAANRLGVRPAAMREKTLNRLLGTAVLFSFFNLFFFLFIKTVK